jgi:hypothetical protein
MFSRVAETPNRVEAGSNTSTVTLRVVGGNEKESLKSETVKYGSRVPSDSDLRNIMLARARPVLLSERALQNNKTVTVNE